MAAIELETLLGLWLLSGWSARLARCAALSFFGLMALVSFYLAWNRQKSCGCLGQIEVSPWFMFGLDVAAVAALLLSSPSTTAAMLPKIWLREGLKTAAGVGVLFVLIGGIFLGTANDPFAALARWRGETIGVEPSLIDVGDGAAGEQKTISIRLTNHGDRTVQIIGGTATRASMTMKALPIALQPGESRQIDVQIMFYGAPGRFQHHFVLYTGNEKQPAITARYAGRAIESSSP